MSAEQPGYLPAPPGVIPNLQNPNQYGHKQGYILLGVGMALSTSLLVVRLHTKAFIARSLGWEDASLLSAYIFGMGTQAIVLHTWIIKASGVHGWEVSPAKFKDFNYVVAWVAIVYVPCLAFAKLAILFLYQRLSPVRWFNIAIYVVMGIVITSSLALVFALAFACNPIAKNWDPTIEEGTCIDKPAVYLAKAGLNAATDVMMLLLPIPMIIKLHMSTYQKLGIYILFAFGSATCITSLVRLYYMVPLLSSPDQTYKFSNVFIWVVVEANLIVICICMPSLRPFIRHYAPSLIGSNDYAKSGTGRSIPAARSSHGPTQPDNSDSRGRRASRFSKYGMISEFDDEIELRQERGHDTTAQASHGPTRVYNDDLEHDSSSEKAIWQTRSFSVTRA